MTTLSLAPARTVLADRVLPRHLAVDAALVVGGAGLTALLAQVEIPLWPVSITGQTLAVLLVGGTLGAGRGAVSMVLYVLAGLTGLGVYAGGHSGVAEVLGSSGGYLLGFVPAAALTGWLAQRRFERTLVRGLLAFLAGSAVVFVVGLPWLQVVLHLSVAKTLEFGLYPFIVGGLIKAAIAALTLRGAWALVERADRSKD